MLFKSSKFYSFITDIPESIFRTPTFKIYYNIPILAFCWINFTFPGSKCIHYVIDNKILHINGSVFVPETLELRAGIAGIRAFSLVTYLVAVHRTLTNDNFSGKPRHERKNTLCYVKV